MGLFVFFVCAAGEVFCGGGARSIGRELVFPGDWRGGQWDECVCVCVPVVLIESLCEPSHVCNEVLRCRLLLVAAAKLDVMRALLRVGGRRAAQVPVDIGRQRANQFQIDLRARCHARHRVGGQLDERQRRVEENRTLQRRVRN